MWRVLIQLPSLISEIIGRLRTLSYLQEQQLLLTQETNLLLREMIVKVTTQAVETPAAVTLDKPSIPVAVDLAAHAKVVKPPYRIRTERDIIRNTPATIAEEQFRQKGLEQFPHRQGEMLPPPNRPLTGPPGV